MPDPDPPRSEPVQPPGEPVELSGEPVELSGEPVELPGEPVEPQGEAHDPTGLTLARAIAASVGAQARRRRAPRRPPEPRVSGAGPDDRDPQLLAAAMGRLVDAKGWSTDISVHTLLGRWALLVGTTNAAHSHPESYADTVLTVRTDSTVWATSLRTMAPQLVAILNEKLGDGTVTRVNVLAPEAPSWKRGRRSVRDGRGPRDTYG